MWERERMEFRYGEVKEGPGGGGCMAEDEEREGVGRVRVEGDEEREGREERERGFMGTNTLQTSLLISLYSGSK